MAYYPHAQRPQPLNNFVVRFSGAPEAIVPQVRQAIKEVNRNLPIDEVVSLSEHIGRSLAPAETGGAARRPSSDCWRCCSPVSGCTASCPTPSRGAPMKSASVWRSARKAAMCSGWCCARALTLVLVGVVIGLLAASWWRRRRPSALAVRFEAERPADTDAGDVAADCGRGIGRLSAGATAPHVLTRWWRLRDE